MKLPLICLGGLTPLFLLGLKVSALPLSLSSQGIDVLRLHQAPFNLSGQKIAIGQVEIGRPPQFGWDKLSPFMRPLALIRAFHRHDVALPNQHLDGHALMVARVMVSQEKKFIGVAPRANLYSGAIGSLRDASQPEECQTLQHIAQQNNQDIRAVNLSFGESLARDERPSPRLDGNGLFTQCLDWSARVHNVVYVVAGNQGRGGIPIPTDNYNGITTAYSMQVDGVFRKVDFANLSAPPKGADNELIAGEINSDERIGVGLLAPGNNIQIYDIDGKLKKVRGTSFAAPHVTASVALLQEAGDRFFRGKQWSNLDHRRSEVMKAILLNSADKIQDSGNGDLLGMTRTVLTQHNDTWLTSDAYLSPQIPLHRAMGAGHLNTFRAYQQLESGQWHHQQPIPSQGWNYDQIQAKNNHEYDLQSPLTMGSYVAITLAWHRLVTLNDLNNNQVYDIGESFADQGLNNLNLYLIDANSEEVVCSSISKVDSVEHIFCPIVNTGKYKIRVEFADQVNENQQPYALAWQTK
ncbi:MAG: S8 family serine peptidase [Cyanobacterium sp. T60_A2020_053]|nr:S8 family serine peptidase [Cyanobacterium sp. T60_A2020_053]